jgi:hypothetical protein
MAPAQIHDLERREQHPTRAKSEHHPSELTSTPRQLGWRMTLKTPLVTSACPDWMP